MQIATKRKFPLKDQIMVFILLFVSGSPLIGGFGKFVNVFLIVYVAIQIKGQLKNKKVFYKYLFRILFFITVIFICQDFVLGFVSVLGILNYLTKFVLGALIVYHLGGRFPELLFKVMTTICLISLVGFAVFNVLQIPMPGISSPPHTSLIIFNFTTEHPTQNVGMFWEPGAFSGLITITLALNLSRLKSLWENQKSNFMIVFLALVTTQSTTGYLVGFFIVLVTFLTKGNKIIAIILLPFVIAGAIYVYTNTDFLNSKINEQYEDTKGGNKAGTEFSNTRFGSLIFDSHYIFKHPIIGNGIHEKTRYADHPYLIQLMSQGVNLGNGNGFSGFLACMGIPFMLGYFYLIYSAEKRRNTSFITTCFLLIMFFDLQGEQWLNAPLFLGLPFLYLLP